MRNLHLKSTAAEESPAASIQRKFSGSGTVATTSSGALKPLATAAAALNLLGTTTVTQATIQATMNARTGGVAARDRPSKVTPEERQAIKDSKILVAGQAKEKKIADGIQVRNSKEITFYNQSTIVLMIPFLLHSKLEHSRIAVENVLSTAGMRVKKSFRFGFSVGEMEAEIMNGMSDSLLNHFRENFGEAWLQEKFQ